MYDLTEVGYVKRIKVGSDNPEALTDESDIRQAMALLNRCLTESPKGKIIGIEKSFALLNIGEHQVVLQWMIYHVAFARKPYWMSEAEAAPSAGAQGRPSHRGSDAAAAAARPVDARAEKPKRKGGPKKRPGGGSG